MTERRAPQAVFSQRLQAERQRRLAALAQHDIDWATLTASDGTNDDTDDSLRLEELEGVQRLIEHERTVLAAVEHALERLQAGTYGQCETCGQPIAAERLDAFPTATHCLSCQQAIDTGQRPGRSRRVAGDADRPR